MSLDNFINHRRNELNIYLNLSPKSKSVIISHLKAVIITEQQRLLAEHRHEDLYAFNRLNPTEQLGQVDPSSIDTRLRRIKSHSTRTFAKNIYSVYLGHSSRLERGIIDNGGNRIEGNRFIKSWLTVPLASALFGTMFDRLTVETAPTLLACCMQLGTAMRMASVKLLTLEEIDKLILGDEIIVMIEKTKTTSRKRCFAQFLTSDPDKTMLLVNNQPIISITLAARALVNGDHPCANPQRSFFKSCVPQQTNVFAIKNQSVSYNYGIGFHEIRRFCISWLKSVPLANHSERDQIIARVADHTQPGRNSTIARYTQNEILDSAIFTT